jgi:CRISPR-associated endonuclease/helicase Cas3
MNQKSDDEYRTFFSDATGFSRPYDWQIRVAVEGLPDVLPIPTGLGKTEGAVLAWAWRRLSAACGDEPLHLVYCLPMRTLVTQTVKRLRECFNAIADKRDIPRIPVYQLMGGVIDDDWASGPDRPWVLVGTQDQLLSRALNRGYAMSRFEWPAHFGLLNQDCHWVVDEVQLMGPGLWTTSQLDWMRRKRFKSLKPCRTTWMSATVGEGFLATTDRMKDGFDTVQPFDPGLDGDESEELRRRRSAVRRLEWFKPSAGKRAPSICEQISAKVLKERRDGTLSLIVCNTVKDAQDVFRLLPDQPPKILLTSRFRRDDRRGYEQQLLDFEARRSKSESGHIEGDPGLVCVSTQVVEAGLDISAHRLWSQLAPWPSTIQRLGRLNRDGRDSDAVAYFWQPAKGKEQKRDGDVGPYSKRDLDSAKDLIDKLCPLAAVNSSSLALKKLEESHPDLVKGALRPKPAPLPRALDVHGLFSTERDLHGGYTDVSAFVRDADPDADLIVFWRGWHGARPPRTEFLSGPPFDPDAEGCRVVLPSLQNLLASRRAKAWLWNDEDDRWEICANRDLRPGMTVMLHRDAGGYDRRLGWTGNSKDTLADVAHAGPGRALADDERSECEYYVPVPDHLTDARRIAEQICESLGLDGNVRTSVVEAAAHHDIGKVHPNWQSRLPSVACVQGGPWAKCPRVVGLDVKSVNPSYTEQVVRLRNNAFALPPIANTGGTRLRWVVDRKLTRKELDTLNALPQVRWAGHVPFRPGMRHEAASALAMWARYRSKPASFPALAVYLSAAHHGKVRTVLRSTTQGGGDVFGVPTQPDSLTIGGQVWPLDFSIAADGAGGEWTDGGFVLTDHGWTGLVSDLLGPWRDHEEDPCDVGAVPENEPRRLGPFALAWLEALVRVADWRASANPSKTISLPEESRDK